MRKPRWQEFDTVLFACMLLLMGVGALFLWSVSERPDLLQGGGEYEYRDTLVRQLRWAGAGLVLFFAALTLPSARWSALAFPLYAACLASLAALLAFAAPINDAKRWFSFGGSTFQPSEVMKIALVLALARLLMFARGSGGWALARAAALVALPAGLVMLQPDMGTALLFVPVGVAMAFVGGVRPRLLLGVLLLVGLLAGGYLKLGLDAYRASGVLESKQRVWGLHAYQWRRIESHLEPETHRSAGAFQAQQARIAIGSGRLWGKGIRSGTQSQLRILPVRQSDFIYAVIGEEWGLAGTSVVLLAYGGILFGCFSTAASAVEPFRRLVATGLGVLLGTEVLLNTAVVVGLLPVTGTPLPLVSQGGSSLVATCLGLGILQSVRMWPGFDLGRG